MPARAPRSPNAVHFVSRATATKRRDERLRPTEVALFEVLRDWDRLVEVPATDAVDRIARLAESGEVRLDQLAHASATEPPRTPSASAASLVPLATLKWPKRCDRLAAPLCIAI